MGFGASSDGGMPPPVLRSITSPNVIPSGSDSGHNSHPVRVAGLAPIRESPSDGSRLGGDIGAISPARQPSVISIDPSIADKQSQHLGGSRSGSDAPLSSGADHANAGNGIPRVSISDSLSSPRVGADALDASSTPVDLIDNKSHGASVSPFGHDSPLAINKGPGDGMDDNAGAKPGVMQGLSDNHAPGLPSSASSKDLDDARSISRRSIHNPQAVFGTAAWELSEDEVEVTERIGLGNFGEVFRGRLWGSDVAVKLMRTTEVTSKEVESLQDEVNILSQLRHPNVVLYMGASTMPPNIFIVTEWCERGSLHDTLYDPS